jgi:hypothetical protein
VGSLHVVSWRNWDVRCFQGILADDLLLGALGILGGPQHPLRADVVDRSQPHRQRSLSREHMPIGLNHSPMFSPVPRSVRARSPHSQRKQTVQLMCARPAAYRLP